MSESRFSNDDDLKSYSGRYKRLSDFVSEYSRSSEPIRACIMTQDIFGPIRNAGIGTAFKYAAEYLASQGHDITILFTQGRVSHSRPIDYWIDFYKERNVKFICADGVGVRSASPALSWSYMGYHTLKQLPPFDIVHSSECGATPYYSIMAKRNFGEFSNTIFCTKTSSPHLWNRQGNDATINLDSGLIICAAERYCVENADLVIAPTKHMLDWMTENGYNLPANSCVQPNPVPAGLYTEDMGPQSGQVKKIDELVFFGRLEPRKGILIFAEALELLYKSGRKKAKVTFLGKKNDNFDFDDFLALIRTRLPFEFKGIHNFDATQAIEYLKSGPRLAVAPSLIDQAALTAYESIIHGVPFIASNVGGIPEIVHPADRARVLFLPRPQALSRYLERSLKFGAGAARLSFLPADNFAVWDAFHKKPDFDKLNASKKRSLLEVEDLQRSNKEIMFNDEAADPLNIDDMLSTALKLDQPYLMLLSNQFSLDNRDRWQLLSAIKYSDADILIPTTTTDAAVPEIIVNFEPSLWTKLEFSKLPLPGLVIKTGVFIQILRDISRHEGSYTTSIDTVVALACAHEARIRVLCAPVGKYKGPATRRLTRRQRARQVEYLVYGLSPDLANMYRLYGGLLDERSRVLAVQAVLKNIQRLLRVLKTLEKLPASKVESSEVSKTARRLAGFPRWRGWERGNENPVGFKRFGPLSRWLTAFYRPGGQK